MRQVEFTHRSPLYWLCAVLAVGIFLFGILALFQPVFGAELFGSPVKDADGLRWVRSAGVRDIALGLMLGTVVLLRQKRTVGILILFMIGVPISDAWTVLSLPGPGYQALLHAGSVLFMVALAVLLLRRR